MCSLRLLEVWATREVVQYSFHFTIKIFSIQTLSYSRKHFDNRRLTSFPCLSYVPKCDQNRFSLCSLILLSFLQFYVVLHISLVNYKKELKNLQDCCLKIL